MIAKHDFTHYDGRAIAGGSQFDALPVEAAALHRSGKARFATAEERARETAPPVVPVVTKEISDSKPKRPRKPRAPRPGGNKKRRDIPKAPITK